MRYILDNEGYVELCSKTPMYCGGRGCTEYTGNIPSGYASLEDWVNNANIRAYKIVDGNLVFDANRDYKLRILYDEEEFANGYVTRREMGITSTNEVNPYASLYCDKNAVTKGFVARTTEEAAKIGNMPVVEARLQPYVYGEQQLDLIEVEFIGNNFLPNTATSTVNNGISYVQNVDKTITVTGTATNKSTLNLAGTDTSVRNILTFKGDYKVTYAYDETYTTEHNNYFLSGLTDGVSLEFYHYDGTTRTLIGVYKNGDLITFTDEVNVTQVLLTIDSGVTINTVLKPMLSSLDSKYLLPMTQYTGEGERNGQYYVDGVSTQKIRNGKNLCKSVGLQGTENIRFYFDRNKLEKTFTISFTPNVSLSSNSIYLDSSNGSVRVGSITGDANTRVLTTITLDDTSYNSVKNASYAEFRLYKGGANFSLPNDAQIENGSVLTSYEAYGISPSPEYPSEIVNIYKAGTYNAIVNNKLYTITLGEDLRGLPNGVGDRLWIKPDDTIDIERKIGFTTISGSDNWYTMSSLNTDTTMWFQSYRVLTDAKVCDALDESNLLCNYFDTHNCYDPSSLSGICYHSDRKIQIRIEKRLLNTQDAAGLIAWLSTHNTGIYYELATYTTSSEGATIENAEYEEYKNNTTLIDMKGHSVGPYDPIIIKDNQAYIKRNGYYTEEQIKEYGIDYEYILLDNVSMPRAYTPYTYAYCHQKFDVLFTYKDPRNIDTTKIELSGSITVDDIKTGNLLINGVSAEENILTSHGIPTTTFLDGKRVYKKLFTGSMPSNTGANIDVALLDFDFGRAWIDQSLSYISTSSTALPTSYYFGDTDYLRIWIDKSNSSIKVRQGANLSSYAYNLVVAYTLSDGTEEPIEEPIVVVNKSSTINGSTNSNYWTFKTEVVEESIDKINKTSTITVTNYLGRTTAAGSSYFMGTFTTNYNCGGKTHSETLYRSSGNIAAGGWYKLGSHTFTISHTTEPMTINVGGSMSTSAFNPSSASASGNITLTEM